MRALKFGNVVLCEYVARGSGNKHTLANAFSGDVLVPEMPANLHMALYIETIPQPTQPKKLDVEVKIGRKVFARIEVSFEDLIPGNAALLVVSPIILEVKEDTTLTVVGIAEGFKRTVALKKRIYKNEPSVPTASVPLSEQSPPSSPDLSSQPEPSRRGSPKRRRRS